MPFDAPSEVLTALAQAASSPATLVTLLGAVALMLLGRSPPARQPVPVRLRARRRR